MHNRLLYLPGLNGLRAIAALAVVICHTMIQLDRFKLGEIQSWSYANARYAVTLFFVLSGFLITYLLLKEKDMVGINIKNFYMRRILKISPLYYLYVVVCITIGPVINMFHDVLSFKIFWFVFYLGNICPFFGTTIDTLGHYWSIGLEEQFYLLWPLVVKMKKKWIILLIITVVSIFLTLKLLGYFLLGKESVLYIFLHINRFHCMLIGALGAILYFEKYSIFLKIVTAKGTQLVSWVTFFIISFDIIHIPSVLTDELFSVTTLSIILGQITVKNRVFNLDNYIFNFLGRISYGIYIIHPLVIMFFLYLIKDIPVSSFIKCVILYTLAITVTVGLAYLSYQYFEKPFLRLKDKFTTIKNTNRKLVLAS